MSDLNKKPEYVRVNVSSATSIPKYDKFGERVAEVSMQLPSNIVSNADQVKEAYMGLMKMFLPMSNVKHVNVGLLDSGEQPMDDVRLWTDLQIGVLPGDFNVTTGRFEMPGECFSLVRPEYIEMSRVRCFPSYISKDPHNSLLRMYEIKQGFHEYHTIVDAISDINDALQFAFTDNKTQVNPETSAPKVWFRVNSDNTLSLCMLVRGAYNMFPVAYPEPAPADRSMIYVKTYPSNRATNTDIGYICGNKALADLFPSLPWIEIPRPTEHYPHPTYVLDTRKSSFSIHSNYATEWYDQSRDMSLLEFKFSATDVMCLTSISSFILTMNGAAFNQQVYPVNFDATTALAAQVTNIPIIDVYYPILSSPAEFTTDLIVIKDQFKDAAPIKVGANFLKERFITFKVWEVLKNGKMREVTIPHNSTFCFQLAFELFPK